MVRSTTSIPHTDCHFLREWAVSFETVPGEVLTGTSDRFIDYLLNRPDVASVWERFTTHPFVLGLGSGKLPLESFKSYLVQDYLYLVQFARANALASYKAKSIEDISAVRTDRKPLFPVRLPPVCPGMLREGCC